jgi:acetoacetyl-CoA synthetase
VAAQIERFLAGFRDYGELHRWSVERPEEFWAAVWRFCGVKAGRGWEGVVWREGEWFPGVELNYAETVLRPTDGAPAVVDVERGRTWSHRELYREVARVVKGFEAAGVKAGDRVAARLLGVPEAVVGFLAAAAMGAVWVPVEGNGSAMAAVNPKLFLATDLEGMERVRALAGAMPDLAQVLVVGLRERSPDLRGLPRALRWQDATALHQRCLEVDMARYPFGHPLLMGFAGGRAVVYPAGGVLLQFLKELVLHLDVGWRSRVRVSNVESAADWARGVTALATGAVLELGVKGTLPEAVLPASERLPDPLAGGMVAALGVGALCPSMPVDWR